MHNKEDLSEYNLVVVDKYTQDWVWFHEIMRTGLFKQGHSDYDIEFIEQHFYAPARRTQYLLKCNGRPVAATCFDQTAPDRAILRGVAVKSTHQGRGHGRALIASIAQAATAAGVTEICVNAAKAKTDFYSAVGFCRDEWGPEEQAQWNREVSGPPSVQMTLRLGDN